MKTTLSRIYQQNNTCTVNYFENLDQRNFYFFCPKPHFFLSAFLFFRNFKIWQILKYDLIAYYLIFVFSCEKCYRYYFFCVCLVFLEINFYTFANLSNHLLFNNNGFLNEDLEVNFFLFDYMLRYGYYY